jgi:DNA mismatch endonuclease, patch repair protein
VALVDVGVAIGATGQTTTVTNRAGQPRSIALGHGAVVPYPEPLNERATKIGKANRRTDTHPETRLRSCLHRRGMRFRKDFVIRTEGLRVRADIVFPGAKVVVFVDGCFWHGCPEHQRVPTRNVGYWAPKLAMNVDRDQRVDSALREAGWHVERIWEHEDPEIAAHRLEVIVRARRARLTRRST